MVVAVIEYRMTRTEAQMLGDGNNDNDDDNDDGDDGGGCI